jgi:transposase-like protein
MTQKRRRHTEQFKFKVALEAAKSLKTINEIASTYNLHPNQVSSWKQQLLEKGATVFGSHTARQQREQAAKEAELYEQIGRLKMELEWLKKSYPLRMRSNAR